jgi:hypothetical protein
LKTLKTDGTFDQHAPVKELLSLKPSRLYSFDLSAATDRLPINLQEDVLSLFIGKRQASL